MVNSLITCGYIKFRIVKISQVCFFSYYPHFQLLQLLIFSTAEHFVALLLTAQNFYGQLPPPESVEYFRKRKLRNISERCLPCYGENEIFVYFLMLIFFKEHTLKLSYKFHNLIFFSVNNLSYFKVLFYFFLDDIWIEFHKHYNLFQCQNDNHFCTSKNAQRIFQL